MSETHKISNQSIAMIYAFLDTIIQKAAAKPAVTMEATKEGTAVAIAKPAASKGRRYSKDERKTILEAVAQGKSWADILSQYGPRHETVTRWQRREAYKYPEKQVVEIAVADENLKKEFSGSNKHWREVVDLWRSRPGLGPMQIKNQLYRNSKIKINVATVRKIMEENGYTPPKAFIKEIELKRYEAVRPREIVHMDFKHFYINKAKVYLLLLQDDFSRFLCGFRMTDSENMKAVIEAFEECVSRYGKMQTVMTDAGSAFYSWNGVNGFQKLISEEYGVDQIKASTPRSNGKIENVNKQIEKEVLNVTSFSSLEEAKTAIEAWVHFYNFERTHMGLPKGVVPADRFLYGWNGEKAASAASVQSKTDSAIDQVPVVEAIPKPLARPYDSALVEVLVAIKKLKDAA